MSSKVIFCHLLLFYPGLSTWPDWHPLIILLAGLRPAWGGECERGHLALRQGTSSPAPLFLSGSQWGGECERGHLALRQGTSSPAPLFLSGSNKESVDMPSKVHLYTLIALLLLLAACSPFGNSPAGSSPSSVATRTPTHLPTTVNKADLCPGKSSQNRNCYTPHALRVAYGVEALTE